QYGTAAHGADITVRSAAGNIHLAGRAEEGAGTLAIGRYAAIGHHGSESDFDAHGDITVEGGNLSLQAGAFRGNGAQIGHGGDGIAPHLYTDSVPPGVFGGSISIDANGDVSLAGGGVLGGSNYAGTTLIGHGGWLRSGDKSGDIVINATGSAELIA